MNTIGRQRQDLADVLTRAGFTVVDHIPEQIRPPVALIAAGSPFVEGGDTFGAFTIRFTVIAVCSQGTNSAATQDLDRYVATALVAVDNASWSLERVDQPTMLATGSANYLSTTIDVSRVVGSIEDT